MMMAESASPEMSMIGVGIPDQRNGRLVLAQAGRARRQVDDADSVENPAVRPLIDTRLWTLRAATSKSGADNVESGRTDDRESS